MVRWRDWHGGLRRVGQNIEYEWDRHDAGMVGIQTCKEGRHGVNVVCRENSNPRLAASSNQRDWTTEEKKAGPGRKGNKVVGLCRQ